MTNKEEKEIKTTKEETTLTEEITAVLEEVKEEPKEKKKGEEVTLLEDGHLQIGEMPYLLIKNYREAFDAERLGERYSDVLARYDYIVGDWGYDQLRLKGFFSNENKKAAPDQRIDTLQDYLYEFCNFGCAYFVIERIGELKREKSYNNRKRRKKNYNNQSKPAHIDEKKQNVTKNKQRPVIKNRKKNEPKKDYPKKETTKKTESNPNRSFTIRQREE